MIPQTPIDIISEQFRINEYRIAEIDGNIKALSKKKKFYLGKREAYKELLKRLEKQ